MVCPIPLKILSLFGLGSSGFPVGEGGYPPRKFLKSLGLLYKWIISAWYNLKSFIPFE
jgi:hypothetical protein